MKRKAPDRWIGYRDVNREHVAMSRSHYLDLVKACAFGEPLRDGRRLLVRESGVRRWVGNGCRSIQQIINQVDRGVSVVEGMRGRATGGRAGSDENYATASGTLEPSGAAATAPISAIDTPCLLQYRAGFERPRPTPDNISLSGESNLPRTDRRASVTVGSITPAVSAVGQKATDPVGRGVGWPPYMERPGAPAAGEVEEDG